MTRLGTKNINNVFVATISAVLALLCFLGPATSSPAAEFRTERLEIHRPDGKMLHFTVELATDDRERQQGLMNREEMKPDHGMLFDFGVSRRVYMWMKNTSLPLDMLFISEKGRVEHIRANTEPQSEAIIDSQADVRYVLEINAGLSETLGITIGDTVSSMQIARTAGQQ